LTSLRPVASQTLRGTVVDATSGAPISMAHVTLLRGSGTIVQSNVTATDGSFIIRVPEPGVYRLRATRIGYMALVTDTLVLSVGQEAEPHLTLQAAGVQLPPVDAVAEARTERLVRGGFYKRVTNGFGYFRTPEQLDSLRPVYHAELFAGMGGVWTGPDGRVRSRSSHKKCYLTVAIDGVIVERGGPSEQPWTNVVHVGDIEAIEVFPGPVGVPVWLSRSVSECGAILVWTKGSR
ncbi:MAG: carboxypeptidase-like regulatory domain-containing protein, partial [Gemmatimonadales bacterium]